MIRTPRRMVAPIPVTWLLITWIQGSTLAHGAGDIIPKSELPTALHADTLRAQILPLHYTTLANELPGRVERIHVREGGTFKAGDPLISLDCALHRAQLDKAKAALTAAEKISSVNAKLAEMKTLGGLEAVTSAAEAAKARAELTLMSTTVSKCTLLAPFPGRVAEQKIREHQYLQAGQPLLEILDDTHLEIEFIAPSRWLSWLKPGFPFALQVDETGQNHPAKVSRIGVRVDPVSQSVKVTGDFLKPTPDLKVGMSGRVAMDPPTPTKP
ncbi:MAG: efflux RND transporter periplasmic adaptor subunit [Magnetococcales bacterium]|nr:efflux RND transporter periplasmic adaptor subunit [Magnetococcales bacterium]